MFILLYLYILYIIYIYVNLYVYNHIFFIHLSVNGHLGSFHVLAIVNSGALNIGYIHPFKPQLIPDMDPGLGLLGYMVALFLVS